MRKIFLFSWLVVSGLFLRAAEGGLDVTITGEVTGERRLASQAPPVELAFGALFPLASDPKTEGLLTYPVSPVDGRDYLPLLQVPSRQAAGIGFAGLLEAPMVTLPWPGGGPWQFLVLDQDGKTVHMQEGGSPPQRLGWDGYKEGKFHLKPGETYTPLLVFFGEPTRRLYGPAVRYDAFLFEEGGAKHIEFTNAFLFSRAGSDIAKPAEPYWQSALDELRRQGAGCRVTVYYRANEEALAARRLENLVAKLKDALETDQVTGTKSPAGWRGSLTHLALERRP